MRDRALAQLWLPDCWQNGEIIRSAKRGMTLEVSGLAGLGGAYLCRQHIL